MKDAYEVFSEFRMMNGVEVCDFCGKWKETENFRGDFRRK
jgi:hypothetical protein